MRKIFTHLWFDKEASAAVDFYTTLFDQSSISSRIVLENTPSGNAELLTFKLCGQDFQAISAGPLFKFNPSMSFMVQCQSKKEINRYWEALKVGGKELMPLDEYPFNSWFGWIQDQYGLSWQFFQTVDEILQKIVPCLMFSGEACGKAEEAMKYYLNVFPHAKEQVLQYYGADETQSKRAKVSFASFVLEFYQMTVMDDGAVGKFQFNESVSFVLYCDTQEEIDYYWKALSFVEEAERCGWVKDKFGVSWQIVPSKMDELLTHGTPEQNQRITEAMLLMKKFDIAALEKARFAH